MEGYPHPSLPLTFLPPFIDFLPPSFPPPSLTYTAFLVDIISAYMKDVFQTIEGGLGFWCSTQFPMKSPKYRINGTPNGYTSEVSSPLHGFGKCKPLDPSQLGIAILSNRLLVPPDGVTLDPTSFETTPLRSLGQAWMAMPLQKMEGGEAPDHLTGHNCWTLFLNAANFRGEVAYWIPQIWSALSEGHPPIQGRGLCSRPMVTSGAAMEVNTVPCRYVQREDSSGNTHCFTKIPQLQFPVDRNGHTLLVNDVCLYNKEPLYSPVDRWFNGTGELPQTGEFELSSGNLVFPQLKASGQMNLKQGLPARGQQTQRKLEKIDINFGGLLATTVSGKNEFCIKWHRSQVKIPPPSP
jgi:hypothetical protein